MERLPELERGTPAALCVAGPHPIPITAYLRAGDDRVLLALGRRREALRRLREDPAVKLLVAVLLLLATPVAAGAATPRFLGTGHDPGIAMDRAGTAHVVWLAET